MNYTRGQYLILNSHKIFNSNYNEKNIYNKRKKNKMIKQIYMRQVLPREVYIGMPTKSHLLLKI